MSCDEPVADTEQHLKCERVPLYQVGRPAMKDAVRSFWIPFNTPLEGRVHYMYCDWKGWVSTGVGNLIDATKNAMAAPSAEEREASLALANQYRWTTPAGDLAGPDLVANDWDAVKAQLGLAAQGHRAYKQFAKLELTDEEIDRMVFVKLDQMETYLKSRDEFKGFEEWPADAQLALLSMSWGMGPAFKFPRFQNYVANADWTGAASECKFQPDQGTIKIRNLLNAQSFRNAARVKDEGHDPSAIVVDLTNTLGIQCALAYFGFDPGPTDGALGPLTTAAIVRYQTASGMEGTGNPSDIRIQLAVALSGSGFTALAE